MLALVLASSLQRFSLYLLFIPSLAAPTKPHNPTLAAAQSQLKVGDSILAIDDVVPQSPKHAVQLIMGAEYVVKFAVIGYDMGASA